jgi:hypothetical protein
MCAEEPSLAWCIRLNAIGLNVTDVTRRLQVRILTPRLSLRASTPVACHRHVPCTTQSAPPAGL